MLLYLHHIATDTFSDAADYLQGEPFPAPSGFEWVEGQPDGLWPYQPFNLEKALSEIFDAQTVELRAQFAPLRAAVKVELDQGHLDVVEAIIRGAVIPAELEPIREQLLETLDG